MNICLWNEDLEGNWDTSCGHEVEVSIGRPIENEMKFCTYCGALIELVDYTEDDQG